MKYIKYLLYILKHKYYVAKLCVRFGLYKQAILHDWSRFTPREFIALSNYYYSGKHPGYFHHNGQDAAFVKEFGINQCAWWHQKLNRHHWEWWIIITDNGDIVPMEIEKRFIKEMIADWFSASLVKTGKLDLVNWYYKNKNRIMIHPKSQRYLERLLPIIEKKYNHLT